MTDVATRRSASRGRTYTGEQLRNVAMPLGGIGTGQVALGGDGGLRQWQLFNIPNHLAAVPDTFFAISSTTPDGPRIVRVLQSREVLALPQLNTPCVNDEAIPEDQRALLRRWSGVERTSFTGAYPFARIAYEDSVLPVQVSLEAFTPFVPLNSQASEIPAVIFRFTLQNNGHSPISGSLGSTLKNVVGWDGVDPIQGNRSPFFGGNVNLVRVEGDRTSLVLENPALPSDHPGQGQLALTTDAPARVYPQWLDADNFLEVLGGARPIPESNDFEILPSSQQGETWNGGLIVDFDLQPGESRDVTFVLSWSFPNHYVNYVRWKRPFREELTKSRLWLGTNYSKRFPTAVSAATHILDNQSDLDELSRRWTETVFDSSLPNWIIEFLAAQGSLIRSPTTFRTDDGRFYGYEGSQGVSTNHHAEFAWGGSCPLNCTHVWNYEQALSRLFPDLERTMRETDYDFVQAPEGYIPHRTTLPLFVTQQWNQVIGGPENPALDGMLGGLLKTYREVQQGAGVEWLGKYWENVSRLYTYITATWDADGDGVLEGEQPNTYDIEFYGTNIFIGGLWLAAARAVEEMAKLIGDDAIAADARKRFELGQRNYDEQLWGGDYYIQTLKDDEPREQQFLTGCLADQLLGQWWAHQLGLGYVLPEAHVKQTLQSIVKHNTRTDFRNWNPEERAFADGDDHGLVIISWPRGDKPERPTRYHDEVWTGIEYQVAAHCIYEGLVDEGLVVLEAARNRHDGVKRNPYNDIECGDHYARAMSGWTILEALSGFRYDASSGQLRFSPALAGAFRAPFVAATGWGELVRDESGGIEILVNYGQVVVSTLELPGAPVTSIRLDDAEIAFESSAGIMGFASAVTIPTSARLRIS